MPGKMMDVQVIKRCFVGLFTIKYVAEIKKFLPQNEPVQIPPPEKSEVLVGDLIREANQNGKFYLGK